jgi:hypothetical protein
MKEAVNGFTAPYDLVNFTSAYYLRDVFAFLLTFLAAFFAGSAGFSSAARAAANRAIGTRNGEQLT